MIAASPSVIVVLVIKQSAMTWDHPRATAGVSLGIAVATTSMTREPEKLQEAIDGGSNRHLCSSLERKTKRNRTATALVAVVAAADKSKIDIWPASCNTKHDMVLVIMKEAPERIGGFVQGGETASRGTSTTTRRKPSLSQTYARKTKPHTTRRKEQ